jgi:4-alpha-glucanotransferase
LSVGVRRSLTALARAWGVQPAYVGTDGKRRAAPVETIVAVLKLLGAPVERPADAAGALRKRMTDLWRRPLEPVAVAWRDRETALALRLPAADLPEWIGCCIELEDGDQLQLRHRTDELERNAEAVVHGETFVELTLPLGPSLPAGYHRATLDCGRRSAECALIAAERTAHDPPTGKRRDWGCFMPLHALHGRQSWGAGSYGDLGRLAAWTKARGGSTLATLPLYPAFLDEPFDPSPYMPVSRLLWNELYLELEADRADGRRLSRLRRAEQVDHRRQLGLQRPIVEKMARDADSDAVKRFLRRHPHVAEYARFRAVGEKLRRPWPEWPARLRDGELRPGDYRRAAESYHAHAQWLAAGQVAALARGAVRLQLDLPLGTHPYGFDVWREPELFAQGASAGCPPDLHFSTGQRWCFPPLHPVRAREQAHRYFADCLRHAMGAAGILRIDHVMSLHRLFWIPDGADAADGAYVRYPAEELYAVLCLESRRARCALVGEDLGVVPREVRPAMRRHGLRSTFVLQHARGPNPRRPLRSLNIEGVASLRTHDMPSFAAFWRGLDAGLHARLGLIDADAARRQRKARERLRAVWQRELGCGPSTLEALEAALAFLADSDAETLLIDLEDLWGENEPHNVPGTTDEFPNWRRRGRYGLEELDGLPRVERLLRTVASRRGRG